MPVREQVAPSVARASSTAAIPVALALFIAALTAASGRFSLTLPFTPVPITLQPLAVLACAAVLGPRLGMLGQVSFLAAGLIGLPVFADSAVLPPGPLRFLGPTGGYLLSYPLAALVAGTIASRGARPGRVMAFASMTVGLAVIYAAGVIWMAGTAVIASHVTVREALGMALGAGLAPFVALDVVKIALAAQIVPALRRGLRIGRE
jgi:biotin transport system substrate-specific component